MVSQTGNDLSRFWLGAESTCSIAVSFSMHLHGGFHEKAAMPTATARWNWSPPASSTALMADRDVRHMHADTPDP